MAFVQFRFRFKVMAFLVEGNVRIENIKLCEGLEKKQTNQMVMCEKTFPILIALLQ